jgi:heme A synthase
MIGLRRLAVISLVLAFCQIVFGAVVRITGSGMGCGDHWPKCLGSWIPPLDRADLIIEVTHRWIALALSIAIMTLVIAAWRKRALPGISGPGGVLRPTVASAALVIAAALLGAVTVKLGLHPHIVVVHLILAMTLLAVLVVVVARTGDLGAGWIIRGAASAKTARGATAAVGLTFVVLVLGALTANTPGAPLACQGFPLCRGGGADLANGVWEIHVAHRIAAILLFLHLVGMVVSVAKRKEPAVIVRAARITLATVVIQIGIAAALVELHLPAPLQSIHQAMGTLVWLTVVAFAVLARMAARPEPLAARSHLADQAA